MIKANELRLGNLITKHFENGKGEIELVTSRTIFDCHANPTGKFSYSGIPLTPEILKKCGAEEDTFWWGDGIEGFHIFTGLEDIERIDIKFGSEDNDRFDLDAVWIGQQDLVKVCQYLHQLQNLYFALSGKELNIDKTLLNFEVTYN